VRALEIQVLQNTLLLCIMGSSTRIAVLFTTALAFTPEQTNSVSAFAPSTSLTYHARNGNSFSRLPSQENAKTSVNMVPEHITSSLYDLDSLQTSVQTAHDYLLHNMNSNVDSSMMLLSDAAEAVVDNADADGGWWQEYLNIFKGGLVSLHSVLEGPLRSVGVTQTWGPSIFLFTFGVRSLLLPLSIQQAKATEYTKALKPYTDQIKIKFKDNKEMINKATAKLSEDTGVNPLTGCFISLAQIPIFLGLYRSITLLAKDGAIDEPFLWIPTLQGPVTGPTFRGMEWLTEGWTFPAGEIPVPHLGWETTLAFLVMPVVLVLGQSITMKTLAPATDTATMSDEEKEQFDKSQGFLKFLPLLIGYFSLQVPAGLTIYWLTSNFFTLSQSLAVRSYYKANPPEIELPDYWDALDDVSNMKPEDKRKAAEAGIATGPSFDDMLDQAKFHFVVERKPLREHSAAWDRVNANKKHEIPTEFASWVNGSVAPATKEKETASV